MTKPRMEGLPLVLIGCVLFLLLGAVLQRASNFAQLDFKQLYYGSKCLLQHRDPYVASQVLATLDADHGALPSDPAAAAAIRGVTALYRYLPTTLLLIAPLAALPYSGACTLWVALIAVSFSLAAFCAWDLASGQNGRLAGWLILLLCINSPLLLVFANAAGIVVSLGVIAAWCFLRNRFVWFGILGLAVSLAIKPHDAGFVWLCFLLLGAVQRRRALWSLVFTLAIGLAAQLWVARSVPHWQQELHANLQASTVQGGDDDPGPASRRGRGIGQIINLQAALSLIRDDPRFYNPAAYLTIGLLVGLWAIATVRLPLSSQATWLGLAAIVCLSMLPVYHRAYDARLLLLAIPACIHLWASRHRTRFIALFVTIGAIVCTGDLFWIGVIGVLDSLHLPATGAVGFASIALRTLPAPVSLLIAGLFFLYMCWRTAAKADLPAC